MKNTAESSVFSIVAILGLVAVIALNLPAKKKAAELEENETEMVTNSTPVAVGGGLTKGDVSVTSSQKQTPSQGQGTNPSPTPRAQSESQMSLPDFTRLTQKTQARLPTLHSLRGLNSEAVHEIPDVLRRAGADLGSIAQALHDNPQLASEAAAFYKECFARNDIPVQVRGLCLADHRNLRISRGDRAEWTAQELQVPREVLKLAMMIPTT